MRRELRRAAVMAAVCGLGLSAFSIPRPAEAADANEQVAMVRQLETQAITEAKTGHFDRTDQILGQAVSISHDPTAEQMANWSTSFRTQLQSFNAERHKEFEKLVSQVKLLLKHDKPDYAMDVAARAYLLLDKADRHDFLNEPWMHDLVTQSMGRALKDDQAEQWIKSLRLYSDLGAVEEAIPKWKDMLKMATRRVRLLAVYAPDELRSMQDSESKDREQVEQLLVPTTRPTTQPADPSAKNLNESFKVDWHETLRGVRMPMLWEALVDADQNYYRGITYKDMALGGLNGVRAIVTTRGLEKAFPKLADENLRSQFLATVDKAVADNQNVPAARQQEMLRLTLAKLKLSNSQTVCLPSEVLVSEFADGAFEKLDPFTSMIWPSDLEEFNKATQGKFSGVGIQIQTDDDGSLKVVSPLEDTPAYRAGIQAGDIITKIDGKLAKGISINQAVRTITGRPATVVTLTVKSPNGTVKDYVLHREEIHVASVKGYVHRPGGGWDYLVDPRQRIGYIRITNFTSDTGAELNSAIETMKLQHVRGIIMDLRYNPGGLLTAATDVADKFLDHGVIVSTRPDRETGNQPTIALAKPDMDDCNLPLIVLVNQYSASASEIVSGALHDDHRAILVGERTFGKGSVQMLFPLADHTAYLKLTTSHYYLPSGRCIHREENSKEWGVDPDVTVDLTPDQMRAAIDARQDLEILREVAPATGEQPKLDQKAREANPVKTKTAAVPSNRKGLLANDPQLSAGLLLLRLQLAGAQS